MGLGAGVKLSSMTGFARTSGEAEWGSWVWEARSVNGRGLDLRVNVPSGLDELETAIKAGASSRFTRGSLQIGLRIELAGGGSDLAVNDAALNLLMEAYQRVDGTIATGPALATLMAMKGVVETGAPALRTLAANQGALAALNQSGEAVLDQLLAARLDEGRKLHDMLFGHLSEVESLCASAVAFAAGQAEALGVRYRTRLAEFDSEGAVSPERIATEIAVLAAKADISEELDRLTAHVGSGRDMLASDAAVGRNLGFLAQELNREANTLCAKSASLDLTNAGIALKGVIDQFKEQAANVE